MNLNPPTRTSNILKNTKVLICLQSGKFKPHENKLTTTLRASDYGYHCHTQPSIMSITKAA